MWNTSNHKRRMADSPSLGATSSSLVRPAIPTKGTTRRQTDKPEFCGSRCGLIWTMPFPPTLTISMGELPYPRASPWCINKWLSALLKWPGWIDRKSTRLELQSHHDLVCRLLLEKKKKKKTKKMKKTKKQKKRNRRDKNSSR